MNKVVCVCGDTLLTSDLSQATSHLRQCTAYLSYSPVAQLFKTLPLASLEEGQLLVLLAEFKGYIQVMSEVLRNRSPQAYSHLYPHLQSLDSVNAYFQAALQEEEEDPIAQLMEKKQEDGMQMCLKRECGQYFRMQEIDMIWYVSTCFHLVCRPCLVSHIETEVPQRLVVTCPVEGCPALLGEQEVAQLVGRDRLDALQRQALDLLSELTVQCVSCQERLQVEEGQVQSLQDGEGHPLAETHSRHYSSNRFKCPACLVEQCKLCHATPYHLGFTCQEHASRCRYCGRKSSENKLCDDQECRKRVSSACLKPLVCGHECGGFKGEKTHLPCLRCSRKADELCLICQVDTLAQAPAVMLLCSHVYHVHCLEQRVQLGSQTARLTFGFCECTVCRQWLSSAPGNPLHPSLSAHRHTYDRILDMTKKRMGMDKIEVTPESLEAGLKSYSYYECFQCKQPFFGGMKVCEAEEEEREFKKEDLVCPGCIPLNPQTHCTRHGKDFIEYKCRYCCGVAQWFCGGSTHYCDKCHSGKRGQAKNCNGVIKKCPLNIQHPPSGQEFPLGCAICRNENANHF